MLASRHSHVQHEWACFRHPLLNSGPAHVGPFFFRLLECAIHSYAPAVWKNGSRNEITLERRGCAGADP